MLCYYIKYWESQGLIEFLPTLGHFFIFLSKFSSIISQFCFLSCLLDLHYKIKPFIPYTAFQTLMRKRINIMIPSLRCLHPYHKYFHWILGIWLFLGYFKKTNLPTWFSGDMNNGIFVKIRYKRKKGKLFINKSIIQHFNISILWD